MKWLLLLIFLSFGISAYAQDTTCFTNSEVLNISNKIKTLDQKTKLQDSLITKFRGQMLNYENIIRLDSNLINYQNQEIDLLKIQVNQYKDLYKVSKVKWYDSKFIWLSIGAGIIMGSSWVVKNVK